MEIISLIAEVNKHSTFKLDYEKMSDGHLLTIAIEKNQIKKLIRLYRRIIKEFKCENLVATNQPTQPIFGRDSEKKLYNLFFSEQSEIIKTIKFIGTHY